LEAFLCRWHGCSSHPRCAQLNLCRG
jgi:hypothetical protein